jgi:hypothetical protein
MVVVSGNDTLYLVSLLAFTVKVIASGVGEEGRFSVVSGAAEDSDMLYLVECCEIRRVRWTRKVRPQEIGDWRGNRWEYGGGGW